MKKTLFLTLLSTLLLCSCTSYVNDIGKFDDKSYKSDLELSNKIDISPNPRDHYIKSYVTHQKDKSVYTVQIVYSDVILNGIKAILIPNEKLESGEILPCVGYVKELKLAAKKDEAKNEYPGFNLSYATKTKDMTFDLFVSHVSEKRVSNVYHIDSFTKLGE